MGGDRLREAVAGLDLVVQIDVADNETSPHAHWLLPATHPWEREDLHLHDTSILPWRETAWTPALVSPPGEARTEADILGELFAAVGPTVRGGVHGAHLRALGALVARAEELGLPFAALSAARLASRKVAGRYSSLTLPSSARAWICAPDAASTCAQAGHWKSSQISRVGSLASSGDVHPVP